MIIVVIPNVAEHLNSYKIWNGYLCAKLDEVPFSNYLP